MGSLAFALGGGLAGGGAAAEKGAQAIAENIMREGLVRLQQQYAEQAQQKGFAHQETMLGKEQAFQREQLTREMQSRSAIAQMEMRQKFEIAHMQVDMERYRADSSYAARVDSMYLRIMASQKGKGAGGAGKQWDHIAINVGQPKNPDGTPNLTAAPIQAAGVVNNRTGKIYNPQGDMMVPWNNNTMSPEAGAARSRAPLSATDAAQKDALTRDLLSDPGGTITSGPNKGMRKSDAYEARYGGLPTAYFDAAQRAEEANGLQGGTTGSNTFQVQLPSGRQWHGGAMPTGVNVGSDVEMPGTEPPVPQLGGGENE